MSPPSSLPPRILHALAAVRRRRRALAVLEAVSWIVCGVCLLAGALVLVTTTPAPAAVRALARVWVVAVVVLPVVLFVVPPWRRTASWSSLARAVDDRVPDVADGLLTAVDLATDLDAARLETPETVRLAEAHLLAADEAADQVRPELILPLDGLPRATLLGPLALLLALGGWFLAPERMSAGFRAVFGPVAAAEVADSEDAPEVVSLTLRNLEIRLTPPAYAKMEEVVLEGTTGDFVALPGTKVSLSADTDARGSEARIELELAEAPIDAKLSGDELEATFTTDSSTWYRVEVPRGFGRDPLVSRRFAIELLPDDFPALEVSAPPGPLTVTPEDSVPLRVIASDDFGLGAATLITQKGDEVVGRRSLGDVKDLAEWEQLVRWEPGSVEVGGDLSLVVEVSDNDTVNGPKITRSRPVEVYVPTARDQRRRVFELKKRLHEVTIDLLADVLVTDVEPDGRTRRPALLEEYDGQVRLAGEFFATAEALLEAMDADELGKATDRAGIYGMVANFDVHWTRVVGFVENTIRVLDRTYVRPGVVEEHLRNIAPVITELEQIALDLESYVDVQSGQELRGDLAQLAETFADTQDALRRAADGEPMGDELQEALEAVRQRMNEIAQKMAERSKGTNDGFANRMPAGSKSKLAEAEELIRQGKFEEAAELLRQLDEEMAALDQELAEEPDIRSGSMDTQELEQSLTEAIEQTRQLEREQEAINQQSQELAEKFADEAANEAMEEIRQDVAKLREQVDALRDVQGGQDIFAPTGAERSSVRSASYEARALDEELEAGRTAAASPIAREAARRLRQAAEASSDRGRAKEERQAAKLAESIADRLDELQQAQQQSRAQARRAGQQAGEQQGSTGESLRGLRERLQQSSGSAFIPAAGKQALQNAQGAMEGSQRSLAEGDPSRANRAGKDGLGQLQAARESLEGALQRLRNGGQQGQAGGEQQGQPGGRMPGREGWDSHARKDNQDSGQTKVTDPDEFVGPEAWRQLLQEGAQGDAPDRYRPLNGTYYEELTR